MSREDANAIRTASQSLQNATYALSQQMYADNSAANGGSTYGSTEPQGDVIEGEFTEA
jgi:hypothetical protein